MACTILTASQDQRLVRLLMQTLGNILNGGEPSQDSIWSTYMSVDEKSNILLYVLFPFLLLFRQLIIAFWTFGQPCFRFARGKDQGSSGDRRIELDERSLRTHVGRLLGFFHPPNDPCPRRELVTMQGGAHLCKSMMEHLKSTLEANDEDHDTMSGGLAVECEDKLALIFSSSTQLFRVEIFKNVFDLGFFGELWAILVM